MVLQGSQRVAVQQIAGHGVTHQVGAPLAVLFLAQVALGIRHRAALQLADDVAADSGDLGQLHGVVALLRPQGAPRGGHADPAELTAQLGLQALGHPPGHLGHLIDILDLSVQHGPAAMLFLLDGQDLQTLF